MAVIEPRRMANDLKGMAGSVPGFQHSVANAFHTNILDSSCNRHKPPYSTDKDELKPLFEDS